MTTYYLRMEGVNLYSFIGDTNDLSTIRGGGLLLLQSAQKVREHFSGLKEIITGASIGFFSFEADNDDEAKKLRKDVAEFLKSDKNLQHGTFVVDVQKSDQNFLQTREKILARNRWRQFQQPTVVIPEKNQSSSIKVCPLDKIRPGTKERTVKKEKEVVSESVAHRRDYGMEQKKRDFYINEINQFCGSLIDANFLNNLEELTSDKTQGNLHHKMAVIYLDGNQFGKIRDNCCKNEEDLKNFNDELRTFRAGALEALLKRMENDDGYQAGERNYRLETLLWGGDELIWVVPAWKGWNVLDCFYKISSSWEFEYQPLTHAGGIVFCHHNAPIHRITKLCNDLAEAAKDTVYFKITCNSWSEMKAKGVSQDILEPIEKIKDKVYEGEKAFSRALENILNLDQQTKDLIIQHADKTKGREGNLFQYLVLESFDHIGHSLSDFRDIECPIPWKLSFKGEDMEQIADKIREIKTDFPRGQIYNAIHQALMAAKSRQTSYYYEAFEERLKEILPDEVLNKIETMFAKEYFGSSPGAWLHLAQLWDYIPEEKTVL